MHQWSEMSPKSHHYQSKGLWLLGLFILAILACTGKKNKDGKNEAGDVVAKSSIEGLLDVSVAVRESEVQLNIKNAPKGSVFECELAKKPLVPCYSGALFKKPLQDGNYFVSVDALVLGKRVATGASQIFTITKGVVGTSTDEPNHPLALRITDPNIKFGMTVQKSKDFVIPFAFVRVGPCQKKEFRCRIGSPVSPFWTVCDLDKDAYTVKSALINMGPQDIGIQALCGDQVGPILNLHWYGVPDDYQDLMLQDLSDGQGRHLIDLIRDIDCPVEKRRYECSASGGAFSLCPNSNQLSQPAPGFKIRLSCEGRFGPALSFP